MGEANGTPIHGSALDGVKVLDFTWAGAGPWCTSYLASFGATVLKVESEVSPDLLRSTPPYKDGRAGFNRAYGFCIANSNKLSITLNMRAPRAVEIARQLVAWADVVTENYVPGVMARWGLTYERLREIKPDIIMVSLSMQGQTGPRSAFAGYGPHATNLCGFAHFTGWPDRVGVQPHIAYNDVVAPWFAMVAILAALDHRRRTGKGQYVDLSQLEAGLSMLATPLLDYTVNEREGGRVGNRSDRAAPHGVYPCKGDDRWCAIAVSTDAEWEQFCAAIGNPDWAGSPQFATFLGRKANEDELDNLVAEWTAQREAEEVMALLQAAGVPAGVVQNAQDLLESDPQLRHREIFPWLEHPELGTALHYGWPVALSKSPAQLRPAPSFGEHTEFICRDILGMADEELAVLLEEGVLR